MPPSRLRPGYTAAPPVQARQTGREEAGHGI